MHRFLLVALLALAGVAHADQVRNAAVAQLEASQPRTLVATPAPLAPAAAANTVSVIKDGVQAWCASGVSIIGSVYSFTGTTVGCGTTPPPPPPVGGNYLSGPVQYNFKPLYTYTTSFAELGNIFGKNPPSVEVYPGYPFSSGTTAVFTQARKGAIIVSHFKTPPTVPNLTLRSPYNVTPYTIDVSVAPSAAGAGIVPGTIAGDCNGQLLRNGSGEFVITTNPNHTQCQVQPNADYTMTLTLDPGACTATVCPFGIVTQH